MAQSRTSPVAPAQNEQEERRSRLPPVPEPAWSFCWEGREAIDRYIDYQFAMYDEEHGVVLERVFPTSPVKRSQSPIPSIEIKQEEASSSSPNRVVKNNKKNAKKGRTGRKAVSFNDMESTPSPRPRIRTPTPYIRRSERFAARHRKVYLYFQRPNGDAPWQIVPPPALRSLRLRFSKVAGSEHWRAEQI